MNMDVTLDAKRVIAPAYLPVQALSFRVVRAGRRGDGQAAHPDPAGRRPERGRRRDRGRADGRRQTDTPKVRTNLSAERHRAAQTSSASHATSTRPTARCRAASCWPAPAARSPRSWATADGHFAVALGGGSVSSLMVSLAGLQIFDALILYVTGDNRIPIKCAVGRLNFQHGTVSFRPHPARHPEVGPARQGQASLISQAVKAEIDADAQAVRPSRPARRGDGQGKLRRRRFRSAASSRPDAGDRHGQGRGVRQAHAAAVPGTVDAGAAEYPIR